MLFHVDMIYLAKQVKRDVERKKLCFEIRTVTISNLIRDLFSFMSKIINYEDVLPVLAQRRAFYTPHVHESTYSSFGRKKIKQIMFYEGLKAQYRLRHRGSCTVSL